MTGPIVKLRAMEPEDLDLLYRIENDTTLWNIGVTNVPYSRYALHDYIANSRNDIYADGQVRLMIDNEVGETVGIVDLINFDPRHQRAELGVVIKNRFRHKGYCTSAVERVLRYSRDILHLHQVYVCVDSESHHTISIFRRIGFSEGLVLPQWLFLDGRYRDAVLMQYFL